MKALLWIFAATVLIGGFFAGVTVLVLRSNGTLADETAAASEKRIEELVASWKGAAPGAAAFVVFDDFDTAGPRRIAGGAAGRALWRSFTKRLGVVQEPALAPRKPMIADFRAPALMMSDDRERQIARMALAMRAVADAGGTVHVVTRGAPAMRAAAEALQRGGVRAKRFVALGTRSLDYDTSAMPAADSLTAAFIEGSPALRAESFGEGGWLDAPTDFSADPIETAEDLADPKPPLVKGRWKGEYSYVDAKPDEAPVPFELFLEQDDQRLTGRTEEPDARPKSKGRPLVSLVSGRANPDGTVSLLKKLEGGAQVRYEGRVSSDTKRIDGRWIAADGEGPFWVATAPPLRTIVVVPRAELEKNMRRGEEPAPEEKKPAEPEKPKGPVKPSGYDVRGEWEGSMKGAATAKASMKLDKQVTPTAASGTFSMSGAELGVQLDVASSGAAELRFPTEGGSVGCEGSLQDKGKTLRATCGMYGEKFTMSFSLKKPYKP